MTAAIIIARGGSKRLPRKNVRQFCGLPLVAWSIIQAKYSWLIDWVFLSTDDDEIQSVGEAYGAEVIRRPDWPDADRVAGNRVYRHAIEEIRQREYQMDRMVMMFPTSPLRLPGDIDAVVEKHMVTGWHVYPVARQRETLLLRDVGGIIAKAAIWDKTGRHLIGNSGIAQACSPSWYEWFTLSEDEWLGEHDAAKDKIHATIEGAPNLDSYYTECEWWQCVEVDTIKEFELAEVLMEHYILKGRGPEVYHEYARGDDDE